MVGKTVCFEGEIYTIVGEAIAHRIDEFEGTYLPMVKLHKVETTICRPNFVCLYAPLSACYFLSSNLTDRGSDWSVGVANA